MGSDPNSFKDATSEPSPQKRSQGLIILFSPAKYMRAGGHVHVLLQTPCAFAVAETLGLGVGRFGFMFFGSKLAVLPW